jgi:hypothetical protein
MTTDSIADGIALEAARDIAAIRPFATGAMQVRILAAIQVRVVAAIEEATKKQARTACAPTITDWSVGPVQVLRELLQPVRVEWPPVQHPEWWVAACAA